MASAIARRRSSSKRRSLRPARVSGLRRVGGAIARKAASGASAAVRRVKSDTQVRALAYGTAGAVAGAVIEAKVPQLPQINGIPPQLMIGVVAVGAGLLLKGKIAEGAVYGGMGPLLAGVSTLARRIASGGTLAGEFDGGPGGFGPSHIAIEGEYDDVV